MCFISTAKAELAAQRQKASELKSGMDIFNISQPAYKELTQNEKVPLRFLIRLALVLVSRSACLPSLPAKEIKSTVGSTEGGR